MTIRETVTPRPKRQTHSVAVSCRDTVGSSAAMEPIIDETEGFHAVAPIPSLPEPVLINILRLLPQHDRLACAALVCKSWATAAIAATTALIVSVQSSAPAGSEGDLDAGLSAFLQRLPGLELLSLRHSQASDAALAQLSCLQQLQDCTLWCPHVKTAVLADLTTSLTSLTLTTGKGVLQEGSLPAAGWPRLKELRVAHHAMRPALLLRLTTLEQLTLNTCELCAGPDMPDSDSKACAAQLLATVAQLTKLKKLDLTNIKLENVDDSDGAPQHGDAAARQLSQFSALTASSQLASLKLAYKKQRMYYKEAYYYPRAIQPFPRGAAVQLFPPGRQLTALTELVIDVMDPRLVEQLREDSHYDMNDDPFDRDTCMRGSDLPLLLAACPKLQRLTLNSVLPSSSAALHNFLENPQVLPQLSYLCLGGLCITDAEAFALAKGAITALRDLELHNSQMLTPHGVAELTELRQLTRLKIDGIGACRCVCAFFTNTSETEQSNVWQKLEKKMPWMHEHHRYWQKYGSAVYDYFSTDSSDSDW